MTRRSDGPRGAAGYVTLELVLGVGLLLLPTAILVLSFPTWVERQSLARVAAREAARTAVLAVDARQGLVEAEWVVATTARNHGVPAGQVSVCFAVHELGRPSPLDCTGLTALRRGQAVTAYVTVRLPALAFPGLGAALDAIPHTARHTERVDLFRSFG